MAVLFLCLISKAEPEAISAAEVTAARRSSAAARSPQEHRKVWRSPEDQHITGRSDERNPPPLPQTTPEDQHRQITADRKLRKITAGYRSQSPEATAGRSHRKLNDILPPETESHQKIIIAINQTENGTVRQPWKQQTAGRRMPPPEIK